MNLFGRRWTVNLLIRLWSWTTINCVPPKYCVESQQNIARARNKAVENAEGDFVAFIDDDEFPTQDWLRTLLATLTEYQVDGVLGPVKPHFDAAPPRWIVEGGFHDRPEDPTGKRLDWG